MPALLAEWCGATLADRYVLVQAGWQYTFLSVLVRSYKYKITGCFVGAVNLPLTFEALCSWGSTNGPPGTEAKFIN